MFPVRDDIQSRVVPWVNYAIIWLNVGVWAWQLSLPDAASWGALREFGLVPARFAEGGATDIEGALLPLLSSMFLHGGWLHIIGNLWMLWIFGDNVEDRLGHGRYLVFYLLVGAAAGLVHVFTHWGAQVPVVGASGAISGVMGAYMVLYPRARVRAFLPILIILIPVTLPAVIFIGLWFVLQFLQGTASLLDPSERGGVAWWAHIGGFVAGMLLVQLFARPQRSER